MKNIIIALSAICIFTGCTIDFTAPEPDASCASHSLPGYCPQNAPFEGVYLATELTTWVCTCPDYSCCSSSRIPTVRYNKLVELSGFVVFTPYAGNPYMGVMNSDLMFYFRGQDETYSIPYFPSLGYFELTSEGIYFRSYEYGSKELCAVAYYSDRGVTLHFQHMDGTPYYSVGLKKLNPGTSCPYDASPYSGKEYGHCYRGSCGTLLSSCITEGKCLWLLENESEQSGSWLDNGFQCLPLEVPERPLGQGYWQ